MCDEFTAATDDEILARKGLTRREFAAIGTAAALASYAPLAAALADDLTERMVEVATPDGKADAFLVHPKDGRHPGVLMWPDVLSLRDSMKLMARRLAGAGFAVLVVNQYYRGTTAPLGMDFATFRTPEGRARIGPLAVELTPEAIARDAAAYVAFLDAQDAVDQKRGVGVHGYCMGGVHAVRSAAASPVRVKAAASFHGGGLVTDKADSPHRLLGESRAGYLIAIARNDDEKSPQEKDILRAAAKDAGRKAEIDVYAADHGWCVPDSPAYDRPEADRAWERLLALYAEL